MTQPSLVLENLTKSYGKNTHALKGIDLTIHHGEFVVIIGPSGAGKSTLIRCINQMVPSTSGSVRFDGIAMEKAKGKELRQQRAKIGMIFQHYNLIERTNVIKNVLHGRLGQMSFLQSSLGRYQATDKQEAYDLLVKVGLEQQIYKKAGALSGGQMQRVGICRAIMQRPKLLLADEPIASLDPKAAETVMTYLKDITTERELTCIVNLHQVEVARQYASRIIGVRDGQIVFDGQSKELTDEMIAHIYSGKEEQIGTPAMTYNEDILVYE
ncbi:phosphonate ABC transporter ATP-binding protein [Enterococcus alcedinis]|uniref:Phosphonates import ATP-binding protein PhnC n=1 Tax=Enterococcus alcedinis TaxID=1274384 RepID=A0A917JH56_9ENTE|nr:phosphonate ABC transporter ATP-binding protein [Enterococcus alcedinis]MBP2103130.1 phosphonate transport system ATP-binding protein [Enterococcus alcedinis]GGI66729.1 phosphonates import ATP-binding protein PhnC [Enterococcus alcedinis]